MERQPALSLDGQWLAFISDLSGTWQMYISQRSENGQWDEPQAIDAINQMNGGAIEELGGPVFSADARRLYFHAAVAGNTDIFYSDFTQGEWQTPEKIGDNINTADDERMPSVSADGRKLFFIRPNPEADGKNYNCGFIYIAERKAGGQWDTPVLLPSIINNTCETSPRISADGSTLYWASLRDDVYGGWDIFHSKRLAPGIWTDADTLPPTINTDVDERMFQLTAAGGYCLFERSDLQKDKSGTLQKLEMDIQPAPYPCMEVAGTVTDLFDETPIPNARIKVVNPQTEVIQAEYQTGDDGNFYFILPKGETYKIDVYKENYSHHFFWRDVKSLSNNKSETIDIQLYSTVNLILNVFDNEIYSPLEAGITATGNGNWQLPASAIDAQGKGRYVLKLPIGKKFDIAIDVPDYDKYSFDFDLTSVVQFNEFEKDTELNPKRVDYTVRVVDKDTRQPVDANLTLINTQKEENFTGTDNRTAEGTYQFRLRQGGFYEVNVNAPNYSFENTAIDLQNSGNTTNELVIELLALRANTKLTLKNITFETNSAELNASSFSELDRVVELMRDNPRLKVEISAHTDDVGSNAYNQRLSDKRARSVVNYMLSNNISTDRLVSKGYGEEQPLLPNDSDENRAQNRRVELKVLGNE